MLLRAIQNSGLPEKFKPLLLEFYQTYMSSIGPENRQKGEALFSLYLDAAGTFIKKPFHFEIFHKSVTYPFDFQFLGLEMIRLLIDFSASKVLGLDHVKHFISQIKNKENVVLLANHQTEIDPQIIHLMLESTDPELARNMIYVAGHRVVSDPLAIPLSIGCNLLCIYSRRYLDHPPEGKSKKVSHNQQTIKKMKELLDQGGQCIYVAPSGGRDRVDENGSVQVASLNPDSIAMFHLMAHKSLKPVHFYPLALYTYPLLPPPATIQDELGESRRTSYGPVSLSFGLEINLDKIPCPVSDKLEARAYRAAYVEQILKQQYAQFFRH